MAQEILDPRTLGVGGLKGLTQQLGIDLRVPSMRELLNQLIQATRLQSPTEYVGTPEYGLSRYDTESWLHDAAVTLLSDLKNILNARGEVQPWFDLIGAGIAKGAVLAGTTFADGVVGSITGLLNVAADATKKDANLMNSFIDNPFSQWMQSINEKAEELLPNYYTDAERESPWYTNIFTANFIGDKFLKNTGFTIGAAASAMLTAGMGAKALGMGALRLAFKGAVTTASGRVLNTASEIAAAYKAGDAFMDGVKLTEDLAKAAKQYRNIELGLKIAGAVTSAAGEGRIEAISNSKDWFNLNKQYLDDDYKRQLDALEDRLYKEDPSLFLNLIGPDGQIQRTITAAGLSKWEERKQQLDNKYNQTLAQMAEQRADMANTIFGWNVALLSASNLFQWGRFLNGGYNSGRIAKNLVKGDAGNLIKNARLAAANGTKVAEETLLKANNYEANKALAKAIASPFMEALEEMSQAWISEGAGLYQASKLNDFYGAKINPEAEEQAIGFLNAAAKGFSNTYGSLDRWEEGALGFLTGLLGIPKIDTNAKGMPRVGLQGELWEGIKEYKDLKQEAQSVTNALNERLLSEDFLNYYQGLIRHNKYLNDMDKALDEGSKLDYADAEHSLFISDAIMFDKANRLQDLYSIIDEYSNLTEDDVKTVRETSVDKETGKSRFDGMSDLLVMDHIKKLADKAKKDLDKYVEISNNLKTLYGENISEDALQEFTWMLTQVDDWESRSQELIKELRESLGRKAKEIKDITGEDVDVLLNNFENFGAAFNKDRDLIKEMNTIIEDNNISQDEKADRIKHLINRVNGRRGFNKKKLNETLRLIDSALNEANLDIALKESEDLETLNQFETLAHKENNAKRIKVLKLAKQLKTKLENLRDATTKDDFEGNRRQRMLLLNNFILETQALLNEVAASRDEQLKQVLPAELLADLLALLDLRDSYRDLQKTNEWYAAEMASEAEEDYRVSEAVLLLRLENLKDALRATDSAFTRLSGMDILDLYTKLSDLGKLYAKRAYFIDKYQTLATNPGLFTDEMQKKIQEVLKQYADKELNLNLDSFNEVTDARSFKEAMAKVKPNLKKSVAEKLKEEGNDDLKPLAKNYLDLEELREQILGNYRADTPELLAVLATINGAINSVNTRAEAVLVIKDLAEEAPEEVAPIYKEILDKINKKEEHKKSNKADSKDKVDKPAEVKKAKKKRKSLLDEGNEDEEFDFDESLDTPLGDARKEEVEEPLPEKKERKRREAPKREEESGPKQETTKGEYKDHPFFGTKTYRLEDVPESIREDVRKAQEAARAKHKTDAEGLLDSDENSPIKFGDIVRWGTSKDRGFGVVVGIGKNNTIEVLIPSSPKSNDWGYETWPVFNRSVDKLEIELPAKKASLNQYFYIITSEEGDLTIQLITAETLEEADNKLKELLLDTDEYESTDDVTEYLDTYTAEELENFNLEDDFVSTLTSMELPLVKDLAKKLAEQKRKAPVSDIQNEGTNDASDIDEIVKREISYLKSWQHTKYDIDSLKERSGRMAAMNNVPLVVALDELGAFDFVDKGFLGTLYNDNKDLELHYIISDDPRLTDSQNNPVALLAVEITDKVKAKVGSKNLTPVDGHNGKLYQVVGVLGYPSLTDTHITSAALKKAWTNYNLTMDAIRGEYDLLDDVPSFYVTDWSNKIKKIYSGRMVKSTSTTDVNFRPLRNVVSLLDAVLGVYYNDSTPIVTPLSEYETVVDLNENNNNPREGSIWLMTKEADGKWYAKAVRTRRFTEEDWNIFDDDLENTPIAKQIREAVKTLVDGSKSRAERARAKLDLKSLLYFPEDTDIVFMDGKDLISIKIGNEQLNDVTAGTESLDEAVNAFLYTLQDDRLNLRMQILPSELSEQSYMEGIYNSDILITDLAQAHNVNASFEMYLNDLDTHKADEITTPDTDERDGHTGKRGKNKALDKMPIFLDGLEFTYDRDQEIFLDKEGNEVDDEDRLAELQLALLIADKEVSTVGSTGIYVGIYEDGTQFGIRGKKILVGKELEDILKKDKKKSSELSRAQAAKRALEEDTPIAEELEDEEDALLAAIDAAFAKSSKPKTTTPAKPAKSVLVDDDILEDLADMDEESAQTPMEIAEEIFNDFKFNSGVINVGDSVSTLKTLHTPGELIDFFAENGYDIEEYNTKDKKKELIEYLRSCYIPF